MDTAANPSSQEEAMAIVVATLSTIRLGTLVGARDSWRFEPLAEGAYALLMRVSDEPTPLQAARVGASGRLFELDVQDRASRESDVVLYLRAPEVYRVWWTLDEQRYTEALDDPAPLFEEGTVIAVQKETCFDHAPLGGQLEAFDRASGSYEFYTRAELRHTICHHILHQHVVHESSSSPIFDVTPACIRALCTVELMQWYERKAQEASANDLATFAHVSAMIQAAEKGLRDAALEHRAEQLFPDGEQRRVFECYRDYTWRCVATGRRRRQFEVSIGVQYEERFDAMPGGLPADGAGPSSEAGSDARVPMAPEDNWLDAATKIRRESTPLKHGPAVHPYFQCGSSSSDRDAWREQVTLTLAQQELLLDYYENYAFGAALRGSMVDAGEGAGARAERGYCVRMQARMEDWVQQSARIVDKSRELLEAWARPEVFFSTVASCYPNDEELIDRYVEAAAFCRCVWWGMLGEAERNAAPTQRDGEFLTEHWPFWKSFKARIKPLAETAKAAGKVSKLLGERLAAYDLSLAEARQMLDTLARLEVTLNGEDVDALRDVVRTDRMLVRLDRAGESGEVRVSLPDPERSPGAPSSVTLRFVRRVPAADLLEAPGLSGSSAVSGERWEAARDLPAPYHVQVPAHLEALRKASRYPKPFALLAESVNLAIAVAAVASDANAKDKTLAGFDLTKSTVGVVESLPGALAAMGPPFDSTPLIKGAESKVRDLRGISTWLSRADGVIKIYKGLDILVSDASDLQYELRHGRTFRAGLQRFAGVANVVAGIPSLVEIAGAVAVAAGAAEIFGFSTALLAGFSATPWGLLLALGGSIVVAGSALALEVMQPWDERFTEVERALDAACQREVRGARFKVSIALDQLLAAVERGWEDASSQPS